MIMPLFLAVSMPLWYTVFHPVTWIVLIPLHILINCAALFLFLNVFRFREKKAAFRQCSVKLCLLSFLADMNGASILFFLMYYGHYDFVLSLAAVLFSGVLIYYFNSRLTFNVLEATESDINRLSIAMAVFTAPYAFLIPAETLLSTAA